MASFKYPEEAENLKGIYTLKEGLLPLIEYPNLNMADPKSLYNFLGFAFENYPARRYALYLGGHIYQFVGISPDYSTAAPSLLGFPEMKKAIEEACRKFNKSLDILFLDTCYGSSLEILYELASKENYIKTLLTFVGKGSLEGLCLSRIITSISRNRTLCTEPLLKAIIEALKPTLQPFEVLAISLNKEVLNLYKSLLSTIAYSYLINKNSLGLALSGEELLSLYDPNLPWSAFFKPFKGLHKFLILHHSFNENFRAEENCLQVLYKFIPDLERKKLYYRLSFSQNSYWFNFLAGLPVDEDLSLWEEKRDVNLEGYPSAVEGNLVNHSHDGEIKIHPDLIQADTSPSRLPQLQNNSIHPSFLQLHTPRKASSSLDPYEENLKPLPLTKEILKTLLHTSTPWLSNEDASSLTNELILLKNWSL